MLYKMKRDATYTIELCDYYFNGVQIHDLDPAKITRDIEGNQLIRVPSPRCGWVELYLHLFEPVQDYREFFNDL